MTQSGNIQFRISLVNVPMDISHLKLRGYLRAEADDIQSKATEHSFFIIRLFLPERTLFAYTQKKLDELLKNIVDKYSSIHRVELVIVKNTLDSAQMQEEARVAEKDIGLLIEDVKAFEETNKEQDKTIH